MRSVKLSDVQRVRFLNAIMESEFKKALETLALGHDSQKKTVSVHFAGKGKRAVKVGYVVENPVWKTSYRLVLAKQDKDKEKDKADKPYLQGWAVVENTTDEDWNGVKMALISGRPISFQMNLYDALFIKRPVVEPELFASLRPPTYSGGLGGAGGAAEPTATAAQLQCGRLGRREGQASVRRPERQPREPGNPVLRRAVEEATLNEKMDLRQERGVGSIGVEAGRLFPVRHRPRGQPAAAEVRFAAHRRPGRRGPACQHLQRKHARQVPAPGPGAEEHNGHAPDAGAGHRLRGQHLCRRRPHRRLAKERTSLLSYAIDLGTEVHAVPHSDNGRITSVKVVKGILYTTTKVKESKTYTIANRNDVDRVVLIEHPHRTDFKLTGKDEPWETARDFRRFKVTCRPAKRFLHRQRGEGLRLPDRAHQPR